MLAAVMAAASFTACANSKAPDPSQAATPDEATPGAATADEATADEACLDFRFDVSARSGNVIYGCDAVFDAPVVQYEINGKNEPLPFQASEVFLNGDTLYYIHKTADDACELYTYSVGSGSTAFCMKAAQWTNFLMKEGSVIYYEEEGVLKSYDMSTDRTITLLHDDVVDSYAVGDKIYYLTADGDEQYPITGILKYYDIHTGRSDVLLDERVRQQFISPAGDDLVFWTTDKETLPQSAQVCKVTPEDNTVQTVGELQTDGALFFISCTDDAFIFQTFDFETGDYATGAMSLADGSVQTDTNANLQLVFLGSHAVSNNAASVLKSEINRDDYYFDTKSGTLKKVLNSSDKRSGEFNYCDGEVCLFDAYKEDQSSAETLRLSDALPSKEEAFKKSTASSPDGEYVRTKKYVPNTCGYISPVPELLIDSEDARQINASMEKNAIHSEYEMYYRYYIADNYLTIFTSVSYTGGVSYNIYTLDLTTGERLSNEDVIALCTDDADAFFDALMEEFRYQQDFTYKYTLSEMEADVLERALPDKSNMSLSKEEIEKYAAEKTIKDFQLGYCGDGKLIARTLFKNAAGASHKSHIFEFEYP